ncbi:MAG: hypothetical protein EOP09_18825 [Proteobacteria bacterium]|nr:MAG: hypothetical protein EOP09_18825 [Pseudomonadota bacterium]
MLSSFAQIAYVNQLIKNRMLLSATAKASINPGLGEYNRYTGKVTLNYRLTKNLLLESTTELNQQKKSLTFPQVIDFSNPAQVSFIASTGAAGLNYSYSFGVKFTVGAAAKKASDQRWAP